MSFSILSSLDFALFLMLLEAFSSMSVLALSASFAGVAKRGIKCLNRAGIEKLNELIEYKQAEENKRINTFKIEER